MANQFLDDLMKASNFLNGNLAQLKANRTINQANESVQQIKASEADEQQKAAQLRQLANGLVMDLSQFGTPAETVQMLSQQIAPQRFFQTPEQTIINPEMASPTQIDAAKGLLQQEHDLKREMAEGTEIRREKTQNRIDQRQSRGQIRDAQKQFFQASKDIQKSLTQAKNARLLLDSGSEITPGAIGTMLARASGEVGNLTEMERSAFEGRQDLVSVAKRYVTKRSFSDLPKGDKEALREIAEIYTNSGDRLLESHAQTLSGQISALPGIDMEENELMKIISGGRYKNPMGKSKGPAGAASNLVPKRVRDKSGQIIEVMQDPATGKLYRK